LEDCDLYLVLEFMDCNLLELQRRGRGGPFSEQEVRNFCFQILKGLVGMHNEGYCHRDLKPKNLFVKGDIIKIGDFRLATNMLHEWNEPLESYAVTSPYRAPELLLGSRHYDFAIDIWAMGVIMAELFTGYQIFIGSNAVRQMNNICSVIGSPGSQTWLQGLALRQMNNICSVIGSPGSQTWLQGLALAASMNYSFPAEFRNVDSTKQFSSLLPSASALAIDLISGCLSWDPKRRPTAVEALHHPFFYPCHNILLPPLMPHNEKPSDTGESTLQINPMDGVGVEQHMPFDYDNHEGGSSRPTASTAGVFRSSYSILP
jgi:protein kinase